MLSSIQGQIQRASLTQARLLPANARPFKLVALDFHFGVVEKVSTWPARQPRPGLGTVCQFGMSGEPRTLPESECAWPGCLISLRPSRS